MASRRMFAKSVVQTDAFLEMPPSSQNLYFHLNMEADDDGFVSSPKRVMKTVSASEDDLKILLAKRFLLAFESGVVVIKHWRMHNLLRNDRYSETTYVKEMSSLAINEFGAYTEKTGEKTVKEIVKPKKASWVIKRQEAKKNSELPYDFERKIRKAFVGKNCPICKIIMGPLDIETVDYGVGLFTAPNIQHNIPISKGGKHELSNISVICGNCNQSIHNKTTGDLNSKEVTEVWNTIGNQSAPRLGKGRVGEDSEGKGRVGELEGQTQPEETSKEDKPNPLVELFEIFWSEYPKKIAKIVVEKKFMALTPILALEIIEDVKKRKATDSNWIDGYGIPHPTTYLNQKRWTDDIIKRPTPAPKLEGSTPHIPGKYANIKTTTIKNE